MSILPQLTPMSIPEFDYVSPKSLSEALSLLGKNRDNARIIAGGSDLLYLLKRGVDVGNLKILVDLKNIQELHVLQEEKDSLHIGAMMTLREVEESALVKHDYPSLGQAAAVVGSPQIRNVATLGGTLCQQVWCWFLREGLKCWRNKGNICYALLPGADTRYYHSIVSAKDCIAVHPSDVAVALVALDTSVSIANPNNTKTISLTDLLVGNVWVSGTLQSHILRSDDILVSVTIPKQTPNSHSFFLRTAIRDVFDFPLANLAFRASLEGRILSDVRVVFGAIAPTPYRDQHVENSLSGKQLSPEVVDIAVANALAETTPLEANAYKVKIARGLLKQALSELSART